MGDLNQWDEGNRGIGWVSAALLLGFAAGYYIAGVVGRRLGRWVVINRD